MILQNIINNYTWNPYGIQCADAHTAKIVHAFLREAILDRHVYTNKIIGFKIKAAATSRPHAGTYIARHKQLAESYPEILTMLLDKVFLNTFDDEISATLSQGPNTVNDVYFLDSNGTIVNALFTRPELCRVIEKNCVLQLKTAYDCGFRDMRQNSKKIGPEYFPCYTDFSIADYVKVLPIKPGDTLVPIRYYHGANPDMLKQILTNYMIYIQSGSVKRSEKWWYNDIRTRLNTTSNNFGKLIV